MNGRVEKSRSDSGAGLSKASPERLLDAALNQNTGTPAVVPRRARHLGHYGGLTLAQVTHRTVEKNLQSSRSSGSGSGSGSDCEVDAQCWRGSYEYQGPPAKRARLTRENIRLLDKMTRSRAPPVSTGDAESRSKTISTTSSDFAAQAAKNGILDPISSKAHKNLRDSIARLNQSRETASPPESVYEDYLDTVGSVPNESYMLIEMTPLLKGYKDRGYRRAFNQPFTAYPKDVGFNNGLSAPQPDFVQGLRQREFRPFPIADELDSAVLFEDNRHSLALPHIAGEWKNRGKNMEGAALQSAYDGAALVHSRNEALAYMGEPDPPSHAAVTTFTTDGTSLNFFGQFAAASEDQLEYQQYPISTINLKSSYEDFKKGRKQLRNAQDYAQEQSKYGFCGTTEDFCGKEKVLQPSCSGKTSASQRIIGYYEGWSSTRVCDGMFPEDLLALQYTHLNFAFALIDPITFAIAPMAGLDKQLWPRFTALKKQVPGLQTWISIGGWSMNDPEQPTAKTFSRWPHQPVRRPSPSGPCWEYPVAPERSGQPADHQNYVSFLKNLRNALGQGGRRYGLTITLPSSYWYMQNFDIKAMEPLVDWFNMMTYDIHGTWDSTNPYIGPHVNSHTNLTEIQLTMDLLWRNKIDPAKVVMGMGFYGCTLSYSEIQDIVSTGGGKVKVVEDKQAAVAIVTWGNNQWVSYDNINTLRTKMDYANSKCLGGVMIWAASTDGPSGEANVALNSAAGRPALLQALRQAAPKKPIGQCVWGECDRDCPFGFSAAKGSGGKTSGYTGIFNGCNGQSRYYCCPTGTDPQCEWKGSPPLCGATSGGRCSSDQVEVTTDTSGGGHTCWTGHKSPCCSHSTGNEDVGKCKWFGSAPFCSTDSAVSLGSSAFFWTSADCDSDHPEKITTGKEGAGGSSHASWWREWGKSVFFQGPLGFLYSGASKLIGQDCQGECPAGQIPIATDGTNCQPGTYSYFCCPNPNAPELAAPGDALCARPDPLQNAGQDPGGPAENVVEQANIYNDDCSEGDEERLRVREPVDWYHAHNWTHPVPDEPPYLVPRGELFKRTRESDLAEFLTYCVSNGKGTFVPQTESGFRTVAGLANKGWISIGKPLVCGAVGLVITSAQPLGIQFVTGHVFEKNSLRNALQHMEAGTLPGGGSISVGKVPQGVLDLGGDVANLQVVDSGLNHFNALVCAYDKFKGSKQTSLWNRSSHKGKVGFLADVIDTFNYMRLARTQGFYNAAFKSLRAMWNIFTTVAAAAGYPQYDYVTAFTEVVNADIAHQVSVATRNFKTILDEVTTLWNDLKVKEIQDALKDFAAQLSTYISYDIQAMAKP
ncbi:hypothetical protein B0T22DRAFT_474971 [Podospora appendiculata]|uniref:chitinase n=1 Tax=Podospora appendiculata TaxID=314037 RepID=A0AAE0XEJ6_9PEZI|nr:hypothetical protein B0T22DRAFT_474971 [Podospora appendiculata]